jgi:hypothetical protein
MSIDCPLSLYDVTVTNMATVRNVQIAIIRKMALTVSVLVLFGNGSNNTVMSV